ncbi:MAG: caspase family protein [Deltaproteobacteria bacterium]|nr:MAG: caspase family protein [Deltaproteobacteria bacterium]
MMRCLVVCLVGLWSVHTANAGWKQVPVSNKKQVRDVLREGLKPKKIALLLGINRSLQSQDWVPLRYAHRDAKQMARALRRQAQFDTILLHTSPKRTSKEAILSTLKRLSRLIKHEEDMVFVYVSAHGTISRGLERYIVTSDTTRNVSQTGLAVKKLRKLLQKLKSRRICLVLATCYTGNVRSKAVKVPGSKGAKRPARPMKVDRAIQILSAASYAQAAFESTKLKADVYTHFFLACMRSLKSKTVIKIHLCATTQTTPYVRKWNGEVQVPKVYSELGANRDFSLSSGLSREMMGYFHSVISRKGSLLFRIFRLGKKSNETEVSRVSADEYTALPPGRYKIRVQDRKGRTVREEEVVIRANVVSQFFSDWTLQIQGGVWSNGGVLQRSSEAWGGGMFGVRHPFFGVFFGVWGSSLAFDNQPFTQAIFEVRLEGGYRHRWSHLELFAGGFASLALVLQDANQDVNLGSWFQAGATVSSALWFHERWALVVSADVGFVPIAQNPRQWGITWAAGGRLGLCYRLGG